MNVHVIPHQAAHKKGLLYFYIKINLIPEATANDDSFSLPQGWLKSCFLAQSPCYNANACMPQL